MHFINYRITGPESILTAFYPLPRLDLEGPWEKLVYICPLSPYRKLGHFIFQESPFLSQRDFPNENILSP